MILIGVQKNGSFIVVEISPKLQKFITLPFTISIFSLTYGQFQIHTYE